MRLVEASPSHIPFLSEHMRSADVMECAAIGRSPQEALSSALRSSFWALTAIVDDEPHAMLGVTSRNMIEGVGVPWMLGTERVYDHGRDLLRYSPQILAEMHASFPVLENLVSADNVRALRYIRRVGFEFRHEPHIIGGIAFVHFRKGAS